MRKFLFLACCFVTLPTFARAQTVSNSLQVSIGSGNQVPNGSSSSPQFALNGRFLVFASNAANLVSDDNNGVTDVYLRDFKKGVLSRLSINRLGVEGQNTNLDGDSTNPAISAVGPDGFFGVAFESNADNLWTSFPDTNGLVDIYLTIPSINSSGVFDPTKGLIELISIAPGGAAADGASSSPSIASLSSPNRLKVVFSSAATNLISGDSNGVRDIFLATISPPKTGTFSSGNISIERISVAESKVQQANGDSTEPVISGNGRYVVFSSFANNLVSGVGVSARQIYRYDTSTGQTILVSKAASGDGGQFDSSSPSISYDGRFIAYLTDANDIVGGTSNTKPVRFDAATLTNSIVNTASDGTTVGTGNATSIRISSNGRFVYFSDSSNNLVSGDNAGNNDVFAKDMEKNSIARVSVGPAGVEANNDSDSVMVGQQGYASTSTLGAYRSFATNLTSQSTANGAGDIYFNLVEFEKRTLNPTTKLEVPPDVTAGKGKLRVVAERFDSATTTAPASLAQAEQASLLEATIPLQIRFEFHVDSTVRGGTRQTIIEKRNSITVRRLRPGNYRAKYRALTVRKSDGKVVRRTRFSPPQKVTVR